MNSLRIRKLRNKEKINIFIANNFVERKGYSILMEAFTLLKQNNLIDKFNIVIAGTGVLFEKYSKEFMNLSSNIILLGWIEQEEYLFNMNNCDVYIHASLFEPFGIPPLDAMARGKLLIVSDGVKSTDRIIEDSINGYVYSAPKSEELYEILKKLNVDTIYTLGMKGQDRVFKEFHNDIFVSTIKECMF